MKDIDILEYKSALKHLAFDSNKTRGRRYFGEEEIVGVDPFILDLNRIRNSKANRRLGYKTQVFSGKKLGPYTQTRLSHSFDVSANAIVLSDFFELNNNLILVQTESHDMGHVIYGHLGEKYITHIMGNKFNHYTNTSYILEYLEKHNTSLNVNNGLNLSYETHEGILNHSRGNSDFVCIKDTTQETTLTMINDKLGYIFSDFQDCKNMGYINKEPECFLMLGKTQRERMQSCNKALIIESVENGFISFNKSKTAQIFIECKDYMYKIYNKIDEKESSLYWNKLDKAYKAICESSLSNEYDPLLFLIMMIEEDVDYLSEKSFITQTDIENTSLKQVLKNIKAINKSIEIGTFDINLCCNK